MTRIEFGSSGIRGPYGDAVTPELALRLGRALGSRYRCILVGHDARTSSPLLVQAATAGMLASGAEVSYGGLAPTPAVAFSGRAFDASLVVTASHNPAPDNGFKPWNPNGKAFDKHQRKEIEDFLNAPTTPSGAPWSGLHAPKVAPSVVAAHTEAILRHVGPLKRRLRVVLDCGNGAACPESPGLLRALGCDVITLNAQPDGAFPGRPSEPSPENLRELSHLVRATGADLGLAHDGDADRCVAVTESGEAVPGDALCALFARAHGKRRIVVPVDMSMLVDDSVPHLEVVKTRVGDAYVSEAIVDRDADWGGEASGAWIFPKMSLCPDGPLAAAAVCALVAEHGPLSKQVASLPKYPIARESRPVPNALKAPVLKLAAGKLEKHGKVNALDGVRVDFENGWVLIRASGTEPKVRVTAEARSAEEMRRLLELGTSTLAACVKEAGA
ncbi:MAG TPA: phosphoglucosamine mutase [Candidatus Thermoplasmatota archaeon]|nr:phosphoglucosamine mutase [Candidatus Thermoplasmatota archaeon]